MSFFYKGRKLSLSDTIGELSLGVNDTPILCLKGGEGVGAPKEFMRLTAVDARGRHLLTFLADDESMAAISFTVLKPL